MTYTISRDGQQFGPYTLADVQRYVGTGNIQLTDLAQAEGSTEWVPVSLVVGTIAVAPAAAPIQYIPATSYPDPPNLHWGLVLLFSVLTCSLFYYAWAIVQAVWVSKIEPTSKALFYYIPGLILVAIYVVLAFRPELEQNYGIIVRIVGSVLIIAGSFNLRASLEQHYTTDEPIGLTLSGVMTFFFATLYFQYHFNRINSIKKAIRTGTGPAQF